jgi:hypothetical protein
MHAEFFGEVRPAVTTVAVAFLEPRRRVEIEADAPLG